MTIHFFCPRWGSEDLGWDEFCEKVRAAGYDGIEFGIAADTTARELEQVWESAAKQNLLMLPQHYDTVTADFSRHLEAYHAWLDRIKPYPAIAVNSQTGKDFFSFEENRQLIELGNRYGILHETHRGKFSFAAHATYPYLAGIPELRLTLDASHWVCVAESGLDDQPLALELAVERTDHIHARVGYAEGPQVPDPRKPEWQDDLRRHLGWWDAVVARKRAAARSLTITPEFGPFPYMMRIPDTGRPVASQWEINVYMMQLLKERYL